MADVQVRGGFPANTTVGLFARAPGALQFNGDSAEGVQSKKTDAQGAVKFTGLDEGQQLWVAAQVDGEWRARQVTAKDRPATGKKVEARPTSFDPSLVAQTHHVVQEGARSTTSARPVAPFAHASAGVPTPAGERAQEPQPHVRQEDVSAPQRSSTITGQATPKEHGELQPRVAQSDLRPGTPQRSDTEFGEATPKDRDETVPNQRQEDAKGPQRVTGDTGAAYPKPKAPLVALEEVKDSSESKAQGATVPVAGTRKAGTGRETKKSSESKVKPASKRAAKKGE